MLHALRKIYLISLITFGTVMFSNFLVYFLIYSNKTQTFAKHFRNVLINVDSSVFFYEETKKKKNKKLKHQFLPSKTVGSVWW